MSKPSTFVVVSGVLMSLSAIALLSLRDPVVAEYFPYFMWIHVAIIAVLSYGSWRLYGARKLSPSGVAVFLRGIPLWLVLVAIPVAVLEVPLWSENTFDLGHTKDGQPVTRKSWNEKGGHYFLKLNNEAPVEIPLAEYQTLQREGYELFARFWVLFSYGSLVLWQYIWRRERASQNAG